MASGSGCGKPVECFVPRGFHGKMMTYKCGQTGVDGYPVLCSSCERNFDPAQFRREVAEAGERIDDDY